MSAQSQHVPAFKAGPIIERTTQQLKIDQIMRASHEVLASATTVFPFTLFPDSIVIDRMKITITKRSFFQSAEVYSIRIEDVLNVTTSVGPVFGSLQIITRVFNTDKPHVINYLWRKDAVHLKHIAQGYIIALHNKLECSELNVVELIQMLEKLGHDTHPLNKVHKSY